MHTPAVVVAGTHSGVGKTTITIALLAALRQRGMRVQPFKVGPDFIDPSFHTRAAGRTSRNLDGWMLSAQTNLTLFAQGQEGADIAVIEGVMGLFDCRDGLTEAGSTAEMAKLLGAPVILVLDASAMARSAAALVRGYESFDEALDVAGVVFNRVAGPGHFAYLREAVEATCRARVLGWLPVDESIRIPERHLGLVMAGEVLDEARLDALASWLGKGLDLSALIELARRRSRAPGSEGAGKDAGGPPAGMRALPGPPTDDRRQTIDDGPSSIVHGPSSARVHRPPSARIGVARDRAFCFYYQDNLDLLANYGAEIVEFSPLSDAHLPDALGGLYLGGGYPELHAAALAANQSMRADIRRFAESGKPVYAECGGLMYLTEAIIDAEGRAYSMVGALPTRTRMQPRLAALGYAEVEGTDNTGWLRAGERARGHEYRYSVIDEMPEHVSRRYRVQTKTDSRLEGFSSGALLASYVHLHFGSCPRFAARLVAACAGKQGSRMKDEG